MLLKTRVIDLAVCAGGPHVDDAASDGMYRIYLYRI